MKLFAILALGVSLLFGSVDINTASANELSSLNGIGSSKAQAIIEFRKGHCFKSVSELSLVKGIGSKTIAKNSDNLTVGKCN